MATGKTRRPSIKSVSRDPSAGKGINALKSCECFGEVDRRVRLGWSSADVSRMIRDEYGELLGFSFNYVKSLVDTYRGEIPPQELALTTENSRVARTAAKKLNNGLNELEELQRLYEMQMERIEIDAQNEKKIGKLFPTTNREMFVAMKLLKQSADLKMDLGLAKRQLGEMSVNQNPAELTKEYGSDSVGQVLTDPDSRSKVLGMVKMLMSATQRADIDATEIIGKEQKEDAIDVDHSETDHTSEEGDQ